MPKIDRIKAEISFHEKMFFAALAVILALIGWAVERYLVVSFWMLALAAVGLFFSLAFAFWSYKRMKRLLEDLENE
jgi:Flp pilus assembly protein TadB